MMVDLMCINWDTELNKMYNMQKRWKERPRRNPRPWGTIYWPSVPPTSCHDLAPSKDETNVIQQISKAVRGLKTVVGELSIHHGAHRAPISGNSRGLWRRRRGRLESSTKP